MGLTVRHRQIFHDILPFDRMRLGKLRDEAASLDGYAVKQGKWLESTKTLLEKRMEASKGRRLLHVMDLGPGHGKHLGQYQQQSRVRVYAFGPHRPSQAPSGVIHLPHFIEESVLPDALDIIQSRWGAIHHSANKAVALENALNSLKPGGHLVLHYHELSGLPIEFEGYRKGHEAELEEDLRKCMRQYRQGSRQEARYLEDNDAFYLSCHVLQELRRQGFQVPTDKELARAHARKGDFVITRQKTKADLQAFYDNPNRRFNPISIFL